METTQAEAPRSKSVSVNSAPIFTKVAYWSVFHSFQPGAKDSTPHWVITKSFKKTKTTSPVYSVTTSIQRAPWWCPMSILTRIRNLQALISEARRCRISCASYQAWRVARYHWRNRTRGPASREADCRDGGRGSDHPRVETLQTCRARLSRRVLGRRRRCPPGRTRGRCSHLRPVFSRKPGADSGDRSDCERIRRKNFARRRV